MALQSITVHDQYSAMLPLIERMRAGVKGEPFVKAKGRTYLPYPSAVDDGSIESQEAYAKYLSSAEFDEFPRQTLQSMTGRMKIGETNIELPDRLSYLENDSDGDGLSMRGAITDAIDDILQVKWRVLVADYQGLSGVDLTSLSKADLAALSPRATIKAYNRENVVNWWFNRINGRLQLAFIMLQEVGSTFSLENYKRDTVTSYLILALDESGNYYQQKLVKSADGIQTGDRSLVTVGGSALKWLPVQIVSDGEIPSGSMPLELGYLSPIVDKAYHSYTVSADHKEALRNLCPTINTTGWTEQKHALFTKVNGRGFIATGSGVVNNLPEGVTADVIGGDTGFEGYQWYFDNLAGKVRAMGGSFKSDQVSNKSATEAAIDSSEQNAFLDCMATSVEAAFERMCLYCGMFEGLWSQDAIEDNIDQITIAMPRDFAQQRMSDQEALAIVQIYMSGLYTKEQAIRMLEQGGWTVGDAEELIGQIEESGVDLSANTAPSLQQ